MQRPMRAFDRSITQKTVPFGAERHCFFVGYVITMNERACSIYRGAFCFANCSWPFRGSALCWRNALGRFAEVHSAGELLSAVPRKRILLANCSRPFCGSAFCWRNALGRSAEVYSAGEMLLAVSRKCILLAKCSRPFRGSAFCWRNTLPRFAKGNLAEWPMFRQN